jgi:Protein of unknown function (DUF4058)
MVLHDWSEVEDGIFHAFHTMWLTHIAENLNDGLLPSGYYALPEQHSEGYISDVATYTTRPARKKKLTPDGGVAVAEPGTEDRVIAARKVVYPGRRIVIRRSGDRRVVAVIELVSPANKDRRESVGMFAGKVVDFLHAGVHVLVIDILPPNRSTPHGIHAAIWSAVENRRSSASVPDARPMLVASYRAEPKPIAYLNYASVGRPLPLGPLYLDATRFVDVPLHATYQTTYSRLPKELKAELRS